MYFENRLWWPFRASLVCFALILSLNLILLEAATCDRDENVCYGDEPCDPNNPSFYCCAWGNTNFGGCSCCPDNSCSCLPTVRLQAKLPRRSSCLYNKFPPDFSLAQVCGSGQGSKICSADQVCCNPRDLSLCCSIGTDCDSVTNECAAGNPCGSDCDCCGYVTSSPSCCTGTCVACTDAGSCTVDWESGQCFPDPGVCPSSSNLVNLNGSLTCQCWAGLQGANCDTVSLT